MKRALPILLLSLACACGSVSFTIPRDGSGTPEAGSSQAGGGSGRSDRRANNPSSTANSKAEPKEAQAIKAALEQIRTGKTAYKIRPADLLEISVFQEQDLQRKVRVGPAGVITLPLIGKVKVGGLDVPAAEEAIAAALRRFLVNPQVSVFVKEHSSSLVYILGEVKDPGSYPIPGDSPITVLEAVTLAGGFTQYAARDRTRVIRETDGKSQTFQVSITAITGGDKSQDIKLEPSDVIFVPESFF